MGFAFQGVFHAGGACLYPLRRMAVSCAGALVVSLFGHQIALNCSATPVFRTPLFSPTSASCWPIALLVRNHWRFNRRRRRRRPAHDRSRQVSKLGHLPRAAAGGGDRRAGYWFLTATSHNFGWTSNAQPNPQLGCPTRRDRRWVYLTWPELVRSLLNLSMPGRPQLSFVDHDPTTARSNGLSNDQQPR